MIPTIRGLRDVAAATFYSPRHVLLLRQPAEVHACSCGDFPTPAQAMVQATKMFSGKVVAVHGGGGTQREPTLISGYVLVEFEVYTVWKGPAFATMFIETAWWSGSCGVEFYVGQEWLVISYDGETTHPCSGTRHLELAQADVARPWRGPSACCGNHRAPASIRRPG